MRKVDQIKAGVILSYVVMIVGYLVSFFYTPAMIKMLGRAEYGNYNYVLSVVNYLSLFSCGFGSAYVRFYSKCKADKNKTIKDIHGLNGMFLTIFLVMGILALLMGLFLSLFSDSIFGGQLSSEELSTAHILMILLVINLFISFPASVFNSYIILKEKFVFQKIVALIHTLLAPCVALVLLSYGHRSVGLAVGSLIVSIVILAINASYCVFRAGMRFSFGYFDLQMIKEIVVFSSFLLLSMVVDQINWSVDKYVLGKLCGTVMVAVYSVAATLNTYYRQMSENVSNVYITRIHKMIADNEGSAAVSDLFIRIGRVQFYILFLVLSGFILFGKAFIYLWLGKGFSEAYYITIILMVPVTIPEIQKIGLEILKAKNLHKFRSVVYFCVAIINVMITIPLAMSFGGIGAACGTAITISVGNGIIMNLYYHKKAEVDIVRFWKNILRQLLGMLPCFLVGLVVFKLIIVDSWIEIIFAIMLYCIAYFIDIWFLSMNESEKRLLLDLKFRTIKNRN